MKQYNKPRKSCALPAFKRHLKTHFFSSQLTPPPSDPPSNARSRPDSLIDFGTI